VISILLSTIERAEYLLRNGFIVPDFLVKRVDGLNLSLTDYDRGQSLVIDSLQDEMDYMEKLINDC